MENRFSVKHNHIVNPTTATALPEVFQLLSNLSNMSARLGVRNKDGKCQSRQRQNNTTGEMEKKRSARRTYFGALSRKGGVGFGRGRGEQCVPVVRRTHLLSLTGWSDGMKGKEEKQGEKK